jgi:hypothetical protein
LSVASVDSCAVVLGVHKIAMPTIASKEPNGLKCAIYPLTN